jgi:hypothetical protein
VVDEGLWGARRCPGAAPSPAKYYNGHSQYRADPLGRLWQPFVLQQHEPPTTARRRRASSISPHFTAAVPLCPPRPTPGPCPLQPAHASSVGRVVERRPTSLLLRGPPHHDGGRRAAASVVLRGECGGGGRGLALAPRLPSCPLLLPSPPSRQPPQPHAWPPRRAPTMVRVV